MELSTIIDKEKAKLDANNIWVSKLNLSSEADVSRRAWEGIYNFTVEKLKEDRKDFDENKLQDNIRYTNESGSFRSDTVYLEIGCGPAHVAEYLMKQYDCFFVGVDFNYPMLLSLDTYLKEKGYTKYILVHADILNMPIIDGSVDYIYGGGVIEHMSDTPGILSELYRVLKEGGVAFNTVPAFNMWWLLRFYSNIPSFPILKTLFEFIHIKLLKSKILERYYGYELSYTLGQLRDLHRRVGFRDIVQKPFAFHPSGKKLKNQMLRRLYYEISSNPLTSPMYCVYGKK